MQYNFRTRLEPNLFSGHFDKAGTVLASRYAHSSCARMTRGAKTGYITSSASVTSPDAWTTYRAYFNRILTRFHQRFFFSLQFSRARKTSVIRVLAAGVVNIDLLILDIVIEIAEILSNSSLKLSRAEKTLSLS